MEKIKRHAKPGEGVEIVASCLEIYNEDLVDLSPEKNSSKLKILEKVSPHGGSLPEVQQIVRGSTKQFRRAVERGTVRLLSSAIARMISKEPTKC